MDAFTSPELLGALAGAALTAIAAFLLRRDERAHDAAADANKFARDDAAETTRLAELTRRVVVLEKDTVSRLEFQLLSSQLGEIRTDVREIRNGMEKGK